MIWYLKAKWGKWRFDCGFRKAAGLLLRRDAYPHEINTYVFSLGSPNQPYAQGMLSAASAYTYLVKKSRVSKSTKEYSK